MEHHVYGEHRSVWAVQCPYGASTGSDEGEAAAATGIAAAAGAAGASLCSMAAAEVLDIVCVCVCERVCVWVLSVCV